MSKLRSELERIAAEFTRAILSAMASAPLDELLEEPRRTRRPLGKGSGISTAAAGDGDTRRARVGTVTLSRPSARMRAPRGELQRQKDAVLTAARHLPPGFRRADATKQSGLTGNLSRALSQLVAEGMLVRKGNRGQARYWISS